MSATDLADRLPAPPAGWSRHVEPTADSVEYRHTVGRASLAKLTVHTTREGYRLAIKRGCRTVDEHTVTTVDAAAETATEVLDGTAAEPGGRT